MIFIKASELAQRKSNFVMVTLVKVIASAPQEEGAKCLITENGLVAGTIGGGKLEVAAIEFAKEMLDKKDAAWVTMMKWNLQTDIGMTCGGVVELLFEKFVFDQWQIAIFGAGHVSQALTRVLQTLNCKITVVDERDEWVEKLPEVKVIKTDDAKLAVAAFSRDTFFLSMTKGHAFDIPFLLEVYRQFPEAPYVGVIGSKSKRNAIINDLKSLDVQDNFINKLHIPIGLPIGNNTPEEIAISVSAQLLLERDKWLNNNPTLAPIK
jgi:xanthine dehydrogenase accessory factor